MDSSESSEPEERPTTTIVLRDGTELVCDGTPEDLRERFCDALRRVARPEEKQ